MTDVNAQGVDIFAISSLPQEDQAALVSQPKSDVDIFAVLRDTATGETDVYRTKARHSTLDETELYDDYRTELFENPLVSFLVNYLTGELMDFHLEGDSADLEKVRLAFDNLDVESQLTIITRQGVLLGNGFGDKTKKGKELTMFRDFDAATVTIDRDIETGEETFKQDGEDLKREHVLVMRLLEYPDTPYGMSFLRASVKALQGMGNLSDDIPAAVKRLAYAEKVLKLDLSEIEDPKQKKEVIRKAKETFEKYDSATAQVTAMDNRHDLKYVGSEGGGVQRIIPMMDVIEPILAFTIMNFYMAIGHVMQTGANKALLQEQEKRARRALLPLKRKFARIVERELVADILGVEIDFKGKKPLTQPLPVRVVHNRDPEEVQADKKMAIQEWTTGLITREFYWKVAGYDPTDKTLSSGTFYFDTPLGQKPTAGAPDGQPQAPDKNGGVNRNGKGGPDGFSESPPTEPVAEGEGLDLQAAVSMRGRGIP